MKPYFKIIGGTFILIGLLLFVYPFYTDWKVNQAQNALKQDWIKLNQTVAQAETARADESEPAVSTTKGKQVPSKAESKKIVTARDIVKKKGIVGELVIPRINLEAIIVKGVDQKSMKNAVGWMPSTSLPGEHGNVVLAAHRSHTYGQFFNRLNEINNGDVITLRSYGRAFTYKVFDSLIVDPADLSVIQPANDEILTLITCHPLNSNKKRLIIKARLAD
ncbi:sortase A [Peribacillus deserti]|uniref:Sortase A n=1 Tax=Peribacillus deserti TaxID=673318 RepID=A0ABS2QLY4_9BACI|nr:class D sortase [Peribacillus deserti]MBM7693473.1 sortase A [Peribacillus deserti]